MTGGRHSNRSGDDRGFGRYRTRLPNPEPTTNPNPLGLRVAATCAAAVGGSRYSTKKGWAQPQIHGDSRRGSGVSEFASAEPHAGWSAQPRRVPIGAFVVEEVRTGSFAKVTAEVQLPAGARSFGGETAVGDDVGIGPEGRFAAARQPPQATHDRANHAQPQQQPPVERSCRRVYVSLGRRGIAAFSRHLRRNVGHERYSATTETDRESAAVGFRLDTPRAKPAIPPLCSPNHPLKH